MFCTYHLKAQERRIRNNKPSKSTIKNEEKIKKNNDRGRHGKKIKMNNGKPKKCISESKLMVIISIIEWLLFTKQLKI